MGFVMITPMQISKFLPISKIVSRKNLKISQYCQK